MQYSTTISQKGQVVIPKEIRDKLKIKPADTLKVELDNEKVVMEPAQPIDNFLGMFCVKKPITKKDIKKSFKKAVSEKSS